MLGMQSCVSTNGYEYKRLYLIWREMTPKCNMRPAQKIEAIVMPIAQDRLYVPASKDCQALHAITILSYVTIYY